MKQFVIGIDLKEQYSQISYWKKDDKEPVSVSVVSGEERYRIATGSTEEFLKKAMRLLRSVGKLSEADAIVFSVKEASPNFVEQVKMAAMRVGIPEEKLYVQTDEESFCSYVMHQPREIHTHHVALFSYEEQELKGTLLLLNQKRQPCLARVEASEDWEIPGMQEFSREEKDVYFGGLIRRVFDQKIISSVFLMGDGFEERWYEKSLQFLCAGRRVFAGNNLFAKGACYRAAENAGAQPLQPYLFFGADKIPCNVGIAVREGQREGTHVLIPAGANWYDAKAECEVILYDKPVVDLLFLPIRGDVVLKESILLDGLPERPRRATRLKIEVSFTGTAQCKIQIWDLGFGELYPATDLVWEEMVEL